MLINQIENHFFTVCSLNYLYYALTLNESLKEVYGNKEFSLKVLISDLESSEALHNLNIDNNIDFIYIDQIMDASKYKQLASYYDILEFNSMLKIYLLRYALRDLNIPSCFFIDPDMYFFDRIDINKYDKEKSLILSPHVLSVNGFDEHSCALELIYAGFINGGIIYVKNEKSTFKILEWLIHKSDCFWFVDPTIGMYADQLWLTSLIHINEFNVGIDTSFSMNVAYWNLHERSLDRKDNKIILKETGETLKLFHFSGFQYPYSGSLTKHLKRQYDEKTDELIQEICINYELEISKSKQKLIGLNIKPAIYFCSEPVAKRIRKAEKIFQIKFPRPYNSIGFFQKIGKKIDAFIF